MRVLAFEDRADIEALLISAEVDMSAVVVEQRWNTEHAVDIVRRVSPDVLLLDHYIPPIRGLEVLRMILDAVEVGELIRPVTIVAMSSAGHANRAMLGAGADYGILKHDLGTLPFWPKELSSSP